MAASINNKNPGWVQIAEIEKILNPFEGITPDIENLQEFPFRSYPKKEPVRVRKVNHPYNPQQLGVELDTLAGKIIEHRWDFQVPDKHGRCPEVHGFEWLLDYIGNKVAEIGGHTLIKSEGGASYNPQAEQSCIWTEDDDGIYETACGNMFELNDTPEHNRMKFCPYCGKVLRQSKDGE
jgi:hypothetical protein